MNSRQALGVAGSIVLLLGIFIPLVTLPVVGSINYIYNGKGDGVIVLVLAAVSFVLALTRRYRFLLWTGLAVLGMLVLTFVNLQTKMSEMRAKVEDELAGNPFGGLASAAVEAVQIQWGWAVLLIGSGCLIAAGLLRDNQNGPPSAMDHRAAGVAPSASLTSSLARLVEGIKPWRNKKERSRRIAVGAGTLLCGLLIWAVLEMNKHYEMQEAQKLQLQAAAEATEERRFKAEADERAERQKREISEIAERRAQEIRLFRQQAEQEERRRRIHAEQEDKLQRQRSELEQQESKEAAWSAFYQPAPECLNSASIECGNAYIRAKADFERRYANGELR